MIALDWAFRYQTKHTVLSKCTCLAHVPVECDIDVILEGQHNTALHNVLHTFTDVSTAAGLCFCDPEMRCMMFHMQHPFNGSLPQAAANVLKFPLYACRCHWKIRNGNSDQHLAECLKSRQRCMMSLPDVYVAFTGIYGAALAHIVCLSSRMFQSRRP